MSTIYEGGPAFPVPNDANVNGQPGMTFRDYLASHAEMPWNAAYETWTLKGVNKISGPTLQDIAEIRAKYKYAEADAMLRAREVSP